MKFGWSCGREAEGGGLLNRYTVEKPYRGFESLRHRHPALRETNSISDISEGGMAVPSVFPAPRLSSARSSLKTVHWTVLSPSATAPHPSGTANSQKSI